MKSTRYYFLLMSFLLLTFAIKAQETDLVETFPDSLSSLSRPVALRFLEIGVSANAYRGDLSGYDKFTACYHLGYKFNEGKRVNARVGIGFGFLTGENRLYRFTDANPNNFFRTPIFHISGELHFNLLKTRNIMLYLSQGIGFLQYDPKTEKGEKLADLTNTRAIDEQYGKISVMLPTGAGAVYVLKNSYSFGIQATFLNTQTDYLDNIGRYGIRDGNDNVFSLRFFMYAPLQFSKVRQVPLRIQKEKKSYTHSLD